MCRRYSNENKLEEAFFISRFEIWVIKTKGHSGRLFLNFTIRTDKTACGENTTHNHGITACTI